MCSEAKLTANRLNAQKSTGPRTPEGKARSCLNALTHGLTARSSALLPTEDPAEYESFSQSLHEELNPQSPLQSALVQQIVNLAWRLLRAPAAESEIFTRYNTCRARRLQEEYEGEMEYYHNQLAWRKQDPRQPEPQKPAEPDLTPLTAPQIMARLFMNREDKANPLSRLQRYEATLHRTLTRTIKDYHLLQQNQANQPAPPQSPLYSLLSDDPLSPAPNEATQKEQIEANPASPKSTDEPITRSTDSLHFEPTADQHFEPTAELQIKANPAPPATGNSDLQSKIQNPQSKIPLPPQSTN